MRAAMRKSVSPILLSVLLGATVAACAGSKPDIKTFKAKGVDFSQFRTIAFGGPGKIPDGYTRGKLPENLVPIARDVMFSTMAEKGYEIVQSPDEADLILVGGVGAKEKMIQRASPVHDGGTFTVAMPEMTVATGAIAIDVFSRASGEQVWGGSLEALLKERPVDPEAFRSALQSLLDEMPGRGSD
jgi:hypothetical protein